MMIFNNDIVAMFEKLEEKAKSLGFDRINAALIVQYLVERKGIVYKYLSQAASYEAIMELLNDEVENYDDKQVISHLAEEDIKWLESMNYDLEKNLGFRVTIKKGDGVKKNVRVTLEVSFMLEYLNRIGIKKLSLEILDAAVIIGYMPDVFIYLMETFNQRIEDIDEGRFFRDLTTDEIDAFDSLVALISLFQKKSEQMYKKEKDKDKFIPTVLEDSLHEFDSKKSIRINARAKEIEKVWNVLMKCKDNNVVLVGDEKIGKSAIVEKIAYLINIGECPEQFKDYKVVKWDLNSIFISTEGEGEKTFSYMKKWLKESRKIILVIDEMPTILESSKMLSISIILKYAMQVFLEEGDNRIIAIASREEYALYFEYTNSMPNNFESVMVREPETDEVLPMIKEQVEYLQKVHGVKISENNLKYIVTIGVTLYKERNPGKTLKIIEKSLITAKSSSKKEVEKEDILKNCNISHERWENLKEEDIISTAFHEAGHYIVGKMCKNVTGIEPNVVSILPAHNFMGVTNFHYTKKSDSMTMDYIIDHIAIDLGGRVAEKIFTGSLSGGAGADLEHATYVAEEMILRYGILRFARNIAIDYDFCDDRMKRKIFKKSKKIIRKAYKRAEEILEDNIQLLFAIVDELRENWILSKEELDEIVDAVNGNGCIDEVDNLEYDNDESDEA